METSTRPAIEGQPPEVQPPKRRQLGGVSRSDRLNLVGAAASGLCVALLLFGRLAPFSGLLGFEVVADLAFLAAYAQLVSLADDGPPCATR